MNSLNAKLIRKADNPLIREKSSLMTISGQEIGTKEECS